LVHPWRRSANDGEEADDRGGMRGDAISRDAAVDEADAGNRPGIASGTMADESIS
jgi:hypothetical protein